MRQVQAIIGGAHDRLDREHNERAWLAWHVAMMGRSKTIPKLEKLMIRQRKAKRAPMSADQQWQLMAALAPVQGRG